MLNKRIEVCRTQQHDRVADCDVILLVSTFSLPTLLLAVADENVRQKYDCLVLGMMFVECQ